MEAGWNTGSAMSRATTRKIEAEKLNFSALPRVARFTCVCRPDRRKPLGSVWSSSLRTKLLPRLSSGVIAQLMWKRPKASVVTTRPRVVTSRTPGRPRSVPSCAPLRLASSKTFPNTSVQSKVGSGMTRTVAWASPVSIVPVRPFTAQARFTYSPSLTPAPTESTSRIRRCPAPGTVRPAQLSSRPATVGAVGTPSISAEPST